MPRMKSPKSLANLRQAPPAEKGNGRAMQHGLGPSDRRTCRPKQKSCGRSVEPSVHIVKERLGHANTQAANRKSGITAPSGCLSAAALARRGLRDEAMASASDTGLVERRGPAGLRTDRARVSEQPGADFLGSEARKPLLQGIVIGDELLFAVEDWPVAAIRVVAIVGSQGVEGRDVYGPESGMGIGVEVGVFEV